MLGGLALPFAIAVGGVATMLVELGGFVLAENCVTGVQTPGPALRDARAQRSPMPQSTRYPRSPARCLMRSRAPRVSPSVTDDVHGEPRALPA
jgi:hypothetical protein